ncbi:28 kDa ribonucleoprotein, chloroplastic [Humulus lupulus]|uniref:28 kDa ribonucleoprotein, chloroplastic n=1 Tax=Humulus lupulus TaxID=3486 RepID=UPI002B4146BB|nr:28 kDa ribonucleoprotein, chloroplastic [Humulus lupulus]
MMSSAQSSELSRAMAASIGPSLSFSSITNINTRVAAVVLAKRVVSWVSPSLFRPCQLRHRKMPIFSVVDGEELVVEEVPVEEEEGLGDNSQSYKDYNRNDNVSTREWNNRLGPCKLYVCNIPRSCDIPDLMEMFKPFGTIFSVEICRNLETGLSKGSGYVTIESIEAAKAAIAALDATDVGGREMRVKFSIHMNSKRRNPESLNSVPLENKIYESPYKVYVGNLAWSVGPEYLRDHFSRLGNVKSARVLRDRKGGKNRVYGFLSFSSAAERDAALSLNGEEFHGRKMIVRQEEQKKIHP